MHIDFSGCLCRQSSALPLGGLAIASFLATVCQGPQDGVEHRIEVHAYIFGEEPQHEVTVFLQQNVFRRSRR